MYGLPRCTPLARNDNTPCHCEGVSTTAAIQIIKNMPLYIWIASVEKARGVSKHMVPTGDGTPRTYACETGAGIFC